jgi:polysaccharide export outer membrane protein
MKFLFFVFLLLVSCSTGNLSPIAELKSNKSDNAPYRVSYGDVLNVQVWGEPKISGEVIVRQDGRFSNPLVNDVEAEGKTLTEIGDNLAEKLKDFIPSASVNVSLTQPSAIVYYLSGSFMKAGEYRTDKRVTLLQAIATGGGFAPFADESNIFLIRKGPNGEKRYQFDYSSVVDGSEPNPDLKSGDIISIR